MPADLHIVPLGGLGEIGENMICIEYGRNILVIDAGIMFPEAEMWGIDYIIPNWEYLRQRKEMIRAVVVTHGHEDHIGALPHFLGEFNVPVYATRLARGLIEVKLRERRMLSRVTLNTYAPGDVVQIGPFSVEPYHVCHSVPDTVGLGITTPVGLIVHTGDFKFDHTPVDGWVTDYAKLAQFRGRGVLVLMSDSTNADQPGHTPSEAVLDDAFHRILREAPGRLIVATFASLISRVQQIVNVAQEYRRKIAVAGRSMVDNVRMARELGYLDIPDEMLVSLGAVDALPAREVVVLATGAQGEPTAALNRLATGRYPQLSLQKGDTVVLSSHTVPGNEELTHALINRLFKRGANVYYDPLVHVHVSGHASQEELKLMINLLRPKFLVPIHGEFRHVALHARIARQLGIPDENIALVENGDMLSVGRKQIRVGERVPSGHILVDGARVGEVEPSVMRERGELVGSGFVTAIVRYRARTGRPLGEPRIITRGFVFVPKSEELLLQAKEVILSAATVSPETPPRQVEERIEAALSRFIYRETRREPVVIAAVMES